MEREYLLTGSTQTRVSRGARGRALLRLSPWGCLAAGEHGQTPPVAKGLERTPTSLVR